MTGASSQDPRPNYIAGLLDSENIQKIAIIDDAYDPPVREEFDDRDIAEFWEEVSADESALDELTQLNPNIQGPEDITDEVLSNLWENRSTLGVLKEYCERFLFGIPNSKLAQLKPLDDTLTGELGREVARYGRRMDFSDTSAKLIFIDYYLGPTPGPEAIAAANRMAKDIYDAYSNEEYKPLIILMSSLRVSEDKVAAFRDESKLIGGMFFFIAKDDLKEKDKLLLKLGALAKSLKYGHKIQRFLDALDTSVIRVAREFMADIKKLSLEDYAYIQTLSLQSDGQPLGDYMLWLYGAYFGHLLFGDGEVIEQRRAIDKMIFKHLPPSQAEPSLQLAEIYKSALFDVNIEPDAIHPRASAPKEDSDNDQMYLHLGDLFFKDINSSVLMVLNAECDLAFAPDTKQRKFPSDRPILLIPGQLHPLNKELSIQESNKVRTEIFEYNGQRFRILWDTKRIVTHTYGRIRSILNKDGYKMIARLRLPFALEVQRAFAADLTRIGMPVPPPIYRAVTVQVFSEGETGKIEALTESSEGAAFLFLTRNGEHLVLNEDFICSLKNKIDRAIEKLEKRKQSLNKEDEGQKKKLGEIKKWIKSLQGFKDNYDALLLLRGPFPLPSGGSEQQLRGQPVWISRGKKVEGTYQYNQPLMLTVIDIEASTIS
jgi:hypothetical protein